MSAICPGLSLRGPARPSSRRTATESVSRAAEILERKPEALALFLRIAEIRGECDEEIESHPAFNQLRSMHLARFYSSYKRRKPRFWVYLLSHGDDVLAELQRREDERIKDGTLARFAS